MTLGIGFYFLGFSSHLGYTDILKAELSAILHELIIYCNASFTLKFSLIPNLHRYVSIIQAIKRLCLLPWEVDFAHILSENN